jgi:hypothetical protein
MQHHGVPGLKLKSITPPKVNYSRRPRKRRLLQGNGCMPLENPAKFPPDLLRDRAGKDEVSEGLGKGRTRMTVGILWSESAYPMT